MIQEGETQERLKQIRERREKYTQLPVRYEYPELPTWKDIDFLLSLLDSQPAGGDLRVLSEIRQRVADGYESASSRNVITVAALALKDLHYVLSSHDGQFARGATAMRDACVAKVKSVPMPTHLSESGEEIVNHFRARIVRYLESLTLDQVKQEAEGGVNDGRSV